MITESYSRPRRAGGFLFTLLWILGSSQPTLAADGGQVHKVMQQAAPDAARVRAGRSTGIRRVNPCLCGEPPVLYVDSDATGPNHDGSSWCSAYKELHQALAVVGFGVVLRIANGTYLPDAAGLGDPREATFQLSGGVTLQGGYAGCGAQGPSARDVVKSETILSGDLMGDDGGAVVIAGVTISNNAYHVVTATDGDSTVVFDGVTIMGGRADGASLPHNHGGGMLIGNNSVQMVGCTFRSNTAKAGGAVWISGGSSVSLDQCAFDGNSNTGANAGGGAIGGEGALNVTGSSFTNNTSGGRGGALDLNAAMVTLVGCTFSGNRAVSGNGGAAAFANCTVLLENSLFEGNQCGGSGGAVDNDPGTTGSYTGCTFNDNSAGLDGGAVQNRDSSPTFIDCTFSGNSAVLGFNVLGGAVFNFGIDADPVFHRCTFTDNRSRLGGAMGNLDGSPTILDSSFLGNSAQDGGAVFNWVSSAPTIARCLFDGNTAFADGGAINSQPGTAPEIDTCVFRGNVGGFGGAMINWATTTFVLDSIFEANFADDRGGAVINISENVLLFQDCVFRGNFAADGGAVTVELRSAPRFVSCLFHDNAAANFGGAVNTLETSTPLFSGCTFTRNRAEAGLGGGLWTRNSTTTVHNSVLWANTDAGGAGTSGQIADDVDGISLVDYSLVQGGWSGLGAAAIVDRDPLFLDPNGLDGIPGNQDDDLRLSDCSPAIDAGDIAPAGGLPPTDLDGNPRVVNGSVDLGAYENPNPCTTPDADRDTVCDPCDNCPNHANAGQEDTDGDGRGDVCDPLDPLEPGPNPFILASGGDLNRTGSMVIPESLAAGGQETAIRITLVELYVDQDEDPEGCPVRTDGSDLSFFDGSVRYLGPPSAFNDNDLSAPRFIAARLQCDPYYRDWSPTALAAEFGAGVDRTTIYFHGAEVVPCSVYEAQHATQPCVRSESVSCFSEPLEIRTALWGDVWPPFGIISFTDINKVVEAFKSIPFVPGDPPDGAPRKMRAVLRGNSAPLGERITFGDIGKAVDAFKRIAYAEAGPTDCP